MFKKAVWLELSFRPDPPPKTEMDPLKAKSTNIYNMRSEIYLFCHSQNIQERVWKAFSTEINIYEQFLTNLMGFYEPQEEKWAENCLQIAENCMKFPEIVSW